MFTQKKICNTMYIKLRIPKRLKLISVIERKRQYVNVLKDFDSKCLNNKPKPLLLKSQPQNVRLSAM